MNRFFEIVVVLFCFEIGLFLVLIPWSTLWEDNIFFLYFPAIRPLLVNIPCRIAVSAMGILDIVIGISEARWRLQRSRIASVKQGL